MDMMLTIAQTSAVLFLACWLTTGVWENVFYPKINSTFTAEVLEMSRLSSDYPEAFAEVAHRRISSPATQRLLFRFIVIWELMATLALWAGVIAMLLSVLGPVATDTARVFALLGVLMFTSTWAGFLIAGNWFCYWFCHEGAQNTHYQMTLWGVATMIFVAL